MDALTAYLAGVHDVLYLFAFVVFIFPTSFFLRKLLYSSEVLYENSCVECYDVCFFPVERSHMTVYASEG